MMFSRGFMIMCFLSSGVTTRLRGELQLKLMGSLPRDRISSMNRSMIELLVEGVSNLTIIDRIAYEWC